MDHTTALKAIEEATALGESIAVVRLLISGAVESQLKSGLAWYLGTAQYKAEAKKQGFPTSALISQP